MPSSPSARTRSKVLNVISIDDRHRRLRAGSRCKAAISAQIGKGEIFAIVGDSGSGKSTLLKTMVGLLPRGATCSAALVFHARRAAVRRPVPERRAVDLDERARERDAADGPAGLLAASGAPRARAVQARAGRARGRRRPLPGEPERRHAQARGARARARARPARALSRRAFGGTRPAAVAPARRARRSACATGSASRSCWSRTSSRASTASPTACFSSTARRTGRWRSASRPSSRARPKARKVREFLSRADAMTKAERDAHRHVRPRRGCADRRGRAVLRRRRAARDSASRGELFRRLGRRDCAWARR